MEHPNSSLLDSRLVVRVVKIASGFQTPAAMEADLNEVDHRRAGRFRFKEDRARFVLGRALLGRLLIEFCRFEKGGPLALASTGRGRPYLEARPDIQFSITHAGDLVAVALALHTQVGIDLELLTRTADHDALAKRIFNAEDLRRFREVPEKQKAHHFFHAWTAKEAWLKARGVGIAEGMELASVPLESNLSPQSISGFAGESWQLQALPVPENYCGNVVWDNAEKSLDFGWVEF